VVAAHAVCSALSEARVHRDAPVEDCVVEQRGEREIHGESRLGLPVPDKLEGLEQAASPNLADMGMITERGFECGSQLDETSVDGRALNEMGLGGGSRSTHLGSTLGTVLHDRLRLENGHDGKTSGRGGWVALERLTIRKASAAASETRDDPLGHENR
jgi:hypothetical protein